jgi:uncharacterized protein
MSSFVRQHPLLTFFVLAYALTWTMVALISVAFLFALLALFGPALAAVVVSAITHGWQGVANLLRPLGMWRVGAIQYVLAIGVPLMVAVFAQAFHSIVFGGPIGVSTEVSIPLIALLALLVVGEEIGWRGFALPRLLDRYSGLVASLILGSVWACWHLANATVPGLEAYLYGFPAFLFFVVGQTIFFTWLWNRSAGSLLLMWILHAAINVSLALFSFGNQVLQWWLAGVAFAVVAAIVVLIGGTALARRPARPLAPQPAE